MNEGDVWTLIIKEHARIREQLEKIPDTRDLKFLSEWLWDHVEEQHHHQEETLLYTALRDIPRLREGGPLCMYFFGMPMERRPIDQAIQLTGQEPKWQDHQQSFREKNSPLLIPIDEHRATRHILQYILEKFDNLDEKIVRELLLIYAKIQSTNMDKEEKCLMHLSKSILPQEENFRIAQLWRKWG